MQFSWIKNKKYLLIACSIFLVLAFALFQTLNQPKERFVKLNLKENDRINMPIPLSENEIFFAGGWDEHETIDPKSGKLNHVTEVLPARIYNLKTKKFKNLNSYLNGARNYDGAIKYDDNNVLILGGYCSPYKKNKNYKDCHYMADNYNILENKFEKLNKTPLRYLQRNQNGLIKTNGKVFIIASLGIMEFDIKTKKFKKLLMYDNEFKYFNGNAVLIDKDNILIWGGSHVMADDIRITGYKSRILKYNISTNKLVELLVMDGSYYKNPITHGIPLDNKKILLSVSGNENGGTIYIYDYTKNKIENWGKTKFGVSSTFGFYLGDNKVFLHGGTINKGTLFSLPTYLDYGILNLKTRGFSNVKKVKRSLFIRYCTKVGKNKIFLGPEINTKAMMFEY